MNSFGISRLSEGGAVNSGLWITASGNVGIGITNPLYALHINNTYNAANAIGILGTGSNQTITPGIKVGRLNIGAHYNDNSPVIWSETSLSIQASNGAVGIPRNNLDVGGNINVAGGLSVSGSATVTGGLTVDGSINNVLTRTDILQLQAMLRLQIYNSVTKPIFLCTPEYPVIGADAWMSGAGYAYWMLPVENNPWIGHPPGGGKNVRVSDNNNGGAPYMSSGGFDNWDFFIIYPGYAIKVWSYINYTNDGNGNNNQPLIFENRSNKIMWWRISNPDIGSTDVNLFAHGVNLYDNGPARPYEGWINTQSSYQVYRL